MVQPWPHLPSLFTPRQPHPLLFLKLSARLPQGPYCSFFLERFLPRSLRGLLSHLSKCPFFREISRTPQGPRYLLTHDNMPLGSFIYSWSVPLTMPQHCVPEPNRCPRQVLTTRLRASQSQTSFVEWPGPGSSPAVSVGGRCVSAFPKSGGGGGRAVTCCYGPAHLLQSQDGEVFIRLSPPS